MRTLHLLALPLPMSIGIAAQAHQEKAVVTLEFHLSEPTYSDDTFELPLKGTRESVHLKKEAALTLKDIAKATASPDGSGKHVVTLHFTPDGAKNLARVTEKNIGKRMGLVVNGKLILAPAIKQKIVTDTLVLGDALTDAEAKELAEGINRAVGQPHRHKSH